MSRLNNTLDQLTPGVRHCRETTGSYRPRHGLAIYHLPTPGWQISSPGMVLGEALAGRSGLGCTLLEGLPAKVPEGAVVIGKYDDIKAVRPDLLEDTQTPADRSEYVIKLGRSGLVAANSPEALAQGLQTLSMLVLRHADDTIPGCVITDSPLRPARCVAVELESGEITAVLLMQIVSFAATFKASHIHIILNDDFNAKQEIPELSNVLLASASYGITLGVRLKLLKKILSGETTIIHAWSRLRAAARVFGATEGALDDMCPGDANPETLRQLVESAVQGETGLKRLSLDARAIVISGVDPARLAGSGVTGWSRVWKNAEPVPAEFTGIPLTVDVQAPVLGLSRRWMEAYRKRLDVALADFTEKAGSEFMISFRDVGVSHMWQNFLYPAANGLIAAWGCPPKADDAADRVLALLYGEAGQAIANMWDAVTDAFPADLPDEDEFLFRRTAFGHWPKTDNEWERLLRPDWLDVAKRIRSAARDVQNAADGLTRNLGTLMGARLSLYALSWLHCFTALAPELESRLRGETPEDGRTVPIAKELFNNFRNWLSCVRETQTDSGLEFSEMRVLEETGLRIQEMCSGVMEPELEEEDEGEDISGTVTVE